MWSLAQIGALGDAGSVPRLPDPPLLAHYLLENPWPVAIAVAIAGIVAMLIARRQGKTNAGARPGFAGIALGCAVLMLGYLVTTERETLRQRTWELADHVAAARTSDLRPMLTEQVRVGAFNTNFLGVSGREEVLSAVQSKIAEFGPLESHEIGPVQAVIDGPDLARTQVRVWVKPNKNYQEMGASPGMWFRIDWRRDSKSGQWRAASITVMQIDFLGMNKEMGRD